VTVPIINTNLHNIVKEEDDESQVTLSVKILDQVVEEGEHFQKVGEY